MMHQFYWKESYRCGYFHQTEKLSQKKDSDIEEVCEPQLVPSILYPTETFNSLNIYQQERMHIESYDFEGSTWSMHCSRE